MTNSKKSSSPKKSTNKQHYDVTFHGIMKWHDHMFEHLGWMILAQQHGYSDKINTYKKSINRLREAIEQKIEETNDKDKLQDLKILHKNTKLLIKHVNKDFA
jgi:predicted ATP-binding protein involved in virulence